MLDMLLPVFTLIVVVLCFVWALRSYTLTKRCAELEKKNRNYKWELRLSKKCQQHHEDQRKLAMKLWRSAELRVEMLDFREYKTEQAKQDEKGTDQFPSEIQMVVDHRA